MAYGTLKVDTITFTDNGSDVNVSVSGLAKNPTFTGDVTATGTISGANIQGGTLVSGATVSGTAGEFGAITGNTAGFTTVTGTTVTGTTINAVSGVFTTQISGVTITGDTGQFTNITGGAAGFTSVTGTTVTGTTANFVTVSGTTVTGDTGQFTNITGGAAGFTSVTGTTVTGTTANFISGVYTTQLSGATITGDAGNFTTATVTSGVFASGTAAAPSVSVGTTDNGLYSPDTNQVALSTSGTQRVQFGTSEVVFNDDGNNYDFRIEGDTVSDLFFVDASADKVGIGTSAPNVKLEVADTVGTVRATSTDTTFELDQEVGRFEMYTPDASGGGAGIAGYTAAISTSTVGSQYALTFGTKGPSDVNAVERFRVDQSGNVGIGSTDPARQLTVYKSSVPIIQLVNSTTGQTANDGVLLYESGSNFVIENQEAGEIQIYNNGSQRAVIDSSGRLLVGTVPSPAYQLQLATDSAGKPSTNTWTIVSDERIKEEIELADLDLCYEAVKNIPLKRFKWKDEVYTEEQAYDRRKLGWIAQDVEAVFPKAVRQHEFKYNQVFEEVVIPAVPAELDDDGNIITEEQPERIEKGELISEEVIEDCRDLNSDQLYAAMYGAIQKLISKVELLETEVQALKAA